ncbi:MAG: hypothetical protein A2504_15950 [Bdellovibrionales bacterium RIFOXYD12_FULL_39_22]|nr:MAG: hypothetical protein A2385_07860 [Bdellovibrionales bacterium RIFOXYB1_FULL_39_21]OFZ43025.1 MAG: hypothetical protein A2485_11365 [Bdellovibrionales bacterium RIFOXYC12_FULL_39_17]OFZ50889.1 MAG: hypothetical protein A2404_06775 [Bdellovibrionales bacterium RIFOXYC1_FULL_39_130]OFZ78112.1 MAG: hypothetical protein A2560_01945 [Bdellovibrionales bacterium RIFOXYD1_FULL_39_84]OFZ93980.1 MAG: hypothetical protein A2504_15950 [Bdellovibrionales bacterium RIFOXYD12_FULL_39_22]HLE10429.1 su
MKRVKALLLAGGLGVRMRRLGQNRLKPLIPYGNCCHLIDFSLNNVLRSNISELVLLSYFEEKKLTKYLLDTWAKPNNRGLTLNFGYYDRVHHEDLETVFSRFIRPKEEGTADALIQNSQFIFTDDVDDLLLLHSDHVYNFDYHEMYKLHRESNAALTIGYQKIDLEYVKLFGMVEVDEKENLINFVEKCPNPTSSYVFSAVCFFNKIKLWEYLEKLAKTSWRHDVSKDIIPAMLAGKETIKCFYFKNYWEDLGTVERYLQSNLNLLAKDSELTIDNMPRTIYPEISRKYVRDSGRIKNSIIVPDLSSGSAQIVNSLIYPHVTIDSDVLIENSIVLSGAKILGKTSIKNSIILENEIVQNRFMDRNFLTEW